MDDIVEISDFCYLMNMGAGHDVWRYHGHAPRHPMVVSGNVSPSSPVEFDEENLILKTSSGRLYKITSFAGDKQKTIDQIKSDIARGGFEIH